MLVEKIKMIKVKRKKGKAPLNLSHDFVQSNKIPVKIKSPQIAEFKLNICQVSTDIER